MTKLCCSLNTYVRCPICKTMWCITCRTNGEDKEYNPDTDVLVRHVKEQHSHLEETHNFYFDFSQGHYRGKFK